MIAGSVRSPTLTFFNVVLSIRSHLRFHMNFMMSFSISVKNTIGLLTGINLFIMKPLFLPLWGPLACPGEACTALGPGGPKPSPWPCHMLAVWEWAWAQADPPGLSFPIWKMERTAQLTLLCCQKDYQYCEGRVDAPLNCSAIRVGTSTSWREGFFSWKLGICTGKESVALPAEKSPSPFFYSSLPLGSCCRQLNLQWP